MTDAALQQKLRNAGQATEGTGTLLLQAADELARLKGQVAKLEAINTALEAALVKVRVDVNTIIDKTVGK